MPAPYSNSKGEYMFNDLKIHDNRVYSGMAVGGEHHWQYTNALWDEQKLTADKWKVHFTALKQRRVDAPEGSGVPLGSQYHWFIIGDQIVKKTTANAYETELNAMKYKIGHKRPYWRGFSYTYLGQQTARQKLISILKETLDELEKQEVQGMQESINLYPTSSVKKEVAIC